MAADEKEILRIMQKVIRIGTVHAYDAKNRTARVKFENLGGIVSAPLKVVSRPRYVVPDPGTKSGSQVAARSLTYDKNDSLTTESHAHAAYVTDWHPKVNDMVLCIFYPDGGGDGFVIGQV